MSTSTKGKKGRPAGQAKGGMNKSQEIRNYFEKNPNAKTQDCIGSLMGRGIEVSQALVSAVRSRLSGKKSGKNKEVTLTEAMLVKNFIEKSGVDEEVATGILNDFADLVVSCGGVDRFREVLSQYKGFTCAGTVEDSIAESETEDSAEENDEEYEDSDESEYEDVNDDEDDE